MSVSSSRPTVRRPSRQPAQKSANRSATKLDPRASPAEWNSSRADASEALDGPQPIGQRLQALEVDVEIGHEMSSRRSPLPLPQPPNWAVNCCSVCS